jgi:nucleotide-binding universal stress UspA family protein
MEATMDRDRYTAVVVGTDGSASASEAVARAATMARARGATLHIVGAYRQATAVETARARRLCPVEIGFDGVGDNRSVTQAIVEDAAEAVAQPDLRIFVHTVEGDPVTALHWVARQKRAEVIVVGNKGTKSWLRFVRRPVCERIARLAPCPIVVVDTEAFWTAKSGRRSRGGEATSAA